MKSSIKYYLSLVILFFLSLSACKKDQSDSAPVINFSLEISGDTVRFTNLTADANTFVWAFGDGDSSTEENPTHIYPGKGKYVPTLYATSSAGGTSNGSTVINISKTSPILLNDNTLSDWDTLSVNVYNSTLSGGGIFIKGKFDYDANKVYFYFEMTAKQADGNIFDFYLDTDNSAGTGYTTGTFSSGGYDELLEGQLLLNQSTAPTPVAAYEHTGTTQSSFSWSYLSLSDFFVIGTVVQDGDTLKFEGSLDRSKLGISNSTAIRLGVVTTKSDWSLTLGHFPDANTDSYLLNLPN